MRTWDLHTPTAKLHQAMKDLQVAVMSISDQWQDDKLREIETTYLEPLEIHLRGAVTCIAELDDILQKADRAIGDY